MPCRPPNIRKPPYALRTVTNHPDDHTLSIRRPRVDLAPLSALSGQSQIPATATPYYRDWSATLSNNATAARWIGERFPDSHTLSGTLSGQSHFPDSHKSRHKSPPPPRWSPYYRDWSVTLSNVANAVRWTGTPEHSPMPLDSPVPLRLICGASDPISGAPMAQRCREVLPGADATVLVGIGPCPHLQAPAEIVRALPRFHGVEDC